MESSERTVYQHYEVERLADGSLHELGRGAMGITYKAVDSNLRVPVALKVITGALLPDARARARFLREARAAAQLRHSNVATVYHLGQEADFCFYTMEFIDGETCDARVRRDGPLDPVTALRICSQVARALQAAHSRGLLHRDLKPSNLMVAQEGGDLIVKVIDFGLVKPLQPDDADVGASLSSGLFLGTPLYASPEQCASEENIDGRSDLYSLGATLWFLLMGEPLFKGSMRSVMTQHITKPPPFETLRGQPPEVAALLGELLAKDPAGRPADAGALRTRIGEVLQALELQKSSLATAAAPVSMPPPGTFGGTSVSAPGFTLEDILRKRGTLPPGEIVFLLPRLAALLDPVAPGQPLPELAPRNIHGRFTSSERSAAGVASYFGLPLREWPPFTLELDSALPATTIALVPPDGTLLEPAQNAPATAVECLAGLVYELLNGSPLAADRPYRPLSVLNEAGNAALRRALPFGPLPGYSGTNDFCAALTRALDGSSSTATPLHPQGSATEKTMLMSADVVPPREPAASQMPPPLPPADTQPPPLSKPPPPVVEEKSAPPANQKPFPVLPIAAGVAALLFVAVLFAVFRAGSNRKADQPATASAATASPRGIRPPTFAPETPRPPAMPAMTPFVIAEEPATPSVDTTATPSAAPVETPAFGTVKIDSDPPGASVSQGNRTLGRTPLTLPQQPAGKITLRVEAPGYEPRNVTGSVPPGGTLALSQALLKRRQPQDVPPPEPIKPPRRASDDTAKASSSQGKSPMRDLQRRAIEQQHRSGQLTNAEYRKALEGLR